MQDRRAASRVVAGADPRVAENKLLGCEDRAVGPGGDDAPDGGYAGREGVHEREQVAAEDGRRVGQQWGGQDADEDLAGGGLRGGDGLDRQGRGGRGLDVGFVRGRCAWVMDNCGLSLGDWKGAWRMLSGVI